MKKPQTEPLFVLFDTGTHPDAVIPQAQGLVRSQSELILGFGSGVHVPSFQDFPTPEFYRADMLEKIQTVQEVYPDGVNILSHQPEQSSVMFFYKQKLLFWYSFFNDESMRKRFLQMNREERRRVDRQYKVPLLPIGIRVVKSPALLLEYNAHVRRFLELQSQQ